MIGTETANAEAPSAELWREFSGPVRAFLRGRTATDGDADDPLQEVFYRIHRQLATLRQPEKLQGWVYRIARNTVIDHYRTRRRHEPLESDPAAEDPTGRDVVDLTPTLRRFIAQLPPPYREPLIQHEFQGAPIHEVAKELGLSLTATKSRIQRARAMLRKMLDQCCKFEFDRRGRVIEAIPRSICECSECSPKSGSSSRSPQSHLR